jgi:hypothetical protein
VRNRVLFRPFILSNFASFAMNAEGEMLMSTRQQRRSPRSLASRVEPTMSVKRRAPGG